MAIINNEMIKDIAIIGAGGLGREISLLIDEINHKNKIFNKIGFYDDNIEPGTVIGDLKVLGPVTSLNSIREKLDIVIAIGNPGIIKSIVDRLNIEMINFPNIIHPDILMVNNRSEIGKGNVFCKGFKMTCDIHIGSYNIFNINVILGHDVRVGNFNVFNPGVAISGEVSISDSNLFGVHSCVLQGIKIGSENILGACSLLTRRIGNGRSYFGTPAQMINKI
jgi:sugar O-acyltransferase (sialic acid O-acetyltransferase NeuD family)